MSKRAHGEGNIRKRADGRWEARISVPQPDGGVKRESVYGKTQAEVRRKLNAATSTIDKGGVLVKEDRQTVAAFLDRWLTDAAAQTVRPSTLIAYRGAIVRYVIPALGKHRLTALAPQHVQAMMRGMADRGLAPRTIHTTRAVLRRALNQAVKWGLVTRNVATLSDPPGVPRKEFCTLTTPEARRLMAAVKGDRLEALYAVAVSLGLRQGELLGLRWQDVDLDRGELRVSVALVKLTGQPFRLTEPKTKRSRRTLPMTPSLVAQLRAHRIRQIEERLMAGEQWEGEKWGLVFTTPTGGPFPYYHLIKQFAKHLTRAGLPAIRFHDLRHSAASLLVAQGVHPRVVMEMLGHSTITLTMNTYSHVMPAAQRDAAMLLEGVLSEAGD